MDKKTLDALAKLQINRVHDHYTSHTFELYNDALDGFMQAIGMTNEELEKTIDDDWTTDDEVFQ